MGKVSGRPVIKGTRVLADAIPENYQAALDEGYSSEEAIAEIHENFPTASVAAIKMVLEYASTHVHQPQP